MSTDTLFSNKDSGSTPSTDDIFSLSFIESYEESTRAKQLPLPDVTDSFADLENQPTASISVQTEPDVILIHESQSPINTSHENLRPLPPTSSEDTQTFELEAKGIFYARVNL
jgi:hypothetical protein